MNNYLKSSLYSSYESRIPGQSSIFSLKWLRQRCVTVSGFGTECVTCSTLFRYD